MLTSLRSDEPLGGIPDAWKPHEAYSYEAEVVEVPDREFQYRYMRSTAIRGWASCSCGFESTPRDDPRIPPLTHREAHQAYLDHLPPGMTTWLAKRANAPKSDSERVARLWRITSEARQAGATSLPIEAVEEALGVYR